VAWVKQIILVKPLGLIHKFRTWDDDPWWKNIYPEPRLRFGKTFCRNLCNRRQRITAADVMRSKSRDFDLRHEVYCAKKRKNFPLARKFVTQIAQTQVTPTAPQSDTIGITAPTVTNCASVSIVSI
jgi:tRNA(Met) C34 N-acetyltransferase TmcA